MVKKAIVIAAAIAAVVLAVFYYNIHTARTAASGSIDAYNELARSYNEKIEKYNAAASSIAAANEELQGVLNEAGSLADQNKKAYEPRTLEKLQKAIKTAEGRLVEAPVQFDPFEMRELQSSFNKSDLEIQKMEADVAATGVEEAMTKIPEIPAVPDYSEQIKAVQDAQKSYENSVQKLANVTAPPDDFVSGRLKRISTVVETGAVTKEQDPNGLLGEKGGYTGCVYFLDERVDRELLPEEAFKKAPDEDEDKAAAGASDEDPAEADTARENAAEGGTSVENAAEAGTTAESSAEAGTAADSAAAAGTSVESAAAAGASGELESSPASGTTAEDTAEGGTSAGTTAENAAASETAASEISEEKEQKPKEVIDVVMIGTVGGGAVEIFPTEEDAQARIEYLRFFEGSLMDPGAFDVEKTCVIRASKYLDAVEQKELIEKIREELLATDE
ncbi:MAG: hypothetical protein Q4F51_02755 [Sarcina sp.]|nr:hypothetical protein [Sarcina sp.]